MNYTSADINPKTSVESVSEALSKRIITISPYLFFWHASERRSKRVHSNEIRNFEGKIRNYFLHSGIFFAINGFKGRNYKEGALGQIRLRLEREGFMISPLDGADLEHVFRTLDLSAKNKW